MVPNKALWHNYADMAYNYIKPP